MLQRAALLVASVMISSVIFTINGDGQTPSSEIPENSSPSALAQQLTEPTDTILTLTEEDFREVARNLGGEVAAIKAVV